MKYKVSFSNKAADSSVVFVLWLHFMVKYADTLKSSHKILLKQCFWMSTNLEFEPQPLFHCKWDSRQFSVTTESGHMYMVEWENTHYFISVTQN